MATINLENPFRNISGAIEKQGIIYRQKHYRDDNGKVIHTGTQEAYAVRNPRDFKNNPPHGAELTNMTRFGLAHRQALVIMQDPDQLQPWKERFNKQLKRSDALAPIDSKTHRRKQYHRLDAFIRAMLIQEMKHQSNP